MFIIFASLALLAQAQTPHDTEDVCARWYALFVELYDASSGVCFDRSMGERGEFEQAEIGDVAACFFRVHCITRLVGLGKDAVERSPPPLFNIRWFF